ncbi:hypothetical protein DCAR_0100450 [Daucus carota subsp. sativus]|uniref:CR-type domain-containing protein n=2 Tax=Daucus carota subsp. sativus TaxID=79200 RepID=A0AAF0W0V3_DAUCS|nr:hypothetical protein DCAR_0100450 [Daucus carota subsp. sativus]
MNSSSCSCAISSILMSNAPQLGAIRLNSLRGRLNYDCASRAAGCVKLAGVVRASMVESSHDNSVNRMERAWLISKQPRPVSCSSCESNGHVECKWCGGTGFFIIGDNMLCQVPSRNTSCVICSGKGSTRCSDCKGTGFRAKWLEEPPVQK